MDRRAKSLGRILINCRLLSALGSRLAAYVKYLETSFQHIYPKMMLSPITREILIFTQL